MPPTPSAESKSTPAAPKKETYYNATTAEHSFRAPSDFNNLITLIPGEAVDLYPEDAKRFGFLAPLTEKVIAKRARRIAAQQALADGSDDE
jgi:hypothetical protein